MNHSNDLAAFIGGGIAAGMAKIMMGGILPPNFTSDIISKVLLTIIVSIVGGVVGMVSKDIYTVWLQPKFKRVLKRWKKN